MGWVEEELSFLAIGVPPKSLNSATKVLDTRRNDDELIFPLGILLW
jgi:hypothetical protein